MSVIAGVVLAAGSSTRLGVPKQLVRINETPILQLTLDVIRQTSLQPRLLVLGYRASEIEQCVGTAGFQVVSNPDFALGQSSSVRKAVEALSDDVDAAVFVLGDQPGIRASVVERLVAAFTESSAPIIQPRYAEGRGNPILIGRALFAELLGLRGDTGARPVIALHTDKIHLVDAADVSRPDDIDTWDDLERVRA
ncbi:MAG: nucleotidyltransferase family protein, partial [Thermomicrobiales bacterium]|nr:nucleotidyltransferase family protein [Thermomicrobiales bacterium]